MDILSIIIGLGAGLIIAGIVVLVLWLFKLIRFGKGETSTTVNSSAGKPAGKLTITAGPYQTAKVSGTSPPTGWCNKDLYAQWSYTTQLVGDGNDVHDPTGVESAFVGISDAAMVYDHSAPPTGGTSVRHRLTIPAQEDTTIVNNDKIVYNLYARYSRGLSSSDSTQLLTTDGTWFLVGRHKSPNSSYDSTTKVITITEDEDRVVPRSLCFTTP